MVTRCRWQMKRAEGLGSRTMSLSCGVNHQRSSSSVLVCEAYHRSMPQNGWLKQHLLSHSFGDWQSRARFRQGWFLGLRGSICASLLIPRGLLAIVGVPWPIEVSLRLLSSCLHGVLSGSSSVSNFSFLLDTSCSGLGPTLMTSP